MTIAVKAEYADGDHPTCLSACAASGSDLYTSDETGKETFLHTFRPGNICEKLGIDLPTYMRRCISRLVQENGIPFPMNLNDLSENKAIKAMKSASRIAAENGLSDMTLDEMNAEVAEARK